MVSVLAIRIPMSRVTCILAYVREPVYLGSTAVLMRGWMSHLCLLPCVDPRLKGFDSSSSGVLSCLKEVSSYRRYETWRGNNTFLWKGKFMLGSDANFFYFTNVLIAAPSALFVAMVCPLFGDMQYYLYAAMAVLLGLSYYYLWLAAFTEPGIIPAEPTYVRAEPPAGADVGLYG
jgi:hypothetical protein